MEIGTIFNIQKFCVNDGPGIRTVVFLKGCPLNCKWCHNPESKSVFPEIFYNKDKCILCARCVSICQNSCHTIEKNVHSYCRIYCIGCGECVKMCPTEALEKSGVTLSVEEVMTEVLDDKLFYDNSGGGLTLSGGEPMLQFDFTLALLKEAKENNINTCVETCGFASCKDFEKVIPYVDLFLFDYKITDNSSHKFYTGVSNEQILNNLSLLDKEGAKIVLRCPIIPSINDKDEHLTAIADIANSHQNIVRIEIEPYHPLGSEKSNMLGKSYELSSISFPDKDSISSWIAKIQQHTNIETKQA